MLKKKVCVLEVFGILSIQCSNVSICGDVYVVFHDSLLEHSYRFSPKYLCYFPYSLRKRREKIDKTILLLRGADVTEELRFFTKLKCMCCYVQLIKQLEVIPFS